MVRMDQRVWIKEGPDEAKAGFDDLDKSLQLGAHRHAAVCLATILVAPTHISVLMLPLLVLHALWAVSIVSTLTVTASLAPVHCIR